MPLRTFAIAALAVGVAACGASKDAAAANALIAQATKLDLDGKQDAAIALFRQALAQAPDSYGAHYGLARALDLAGAYDEARQHFARAIALAPDSDKDQPTRMLGIAWTFVHNAGEASRYFREVFDRRMAAGNFAAASDEAAEIGRVYLELGDPDQAEPWYRTSHETALREADLVQWRIDLADMRWAHAQARIAARRGRAADAHAQADIVKRLLANGGNDDQQVQYRYLVGYVDFYLGDDRAAIAPLEQADQKDPFILLLLGEAHEHLGDRDIARDYYAQVLASTSHAVNNAFARPVAKQKLGQ